MHDPTGLYPYQYLLQNGKMLQAGPDVGNTFMLTPNTWSWSSVPPLMTAHYGYGNGIIYNDASVSPVSQVVTIAGGVDATKTLSNNEYLDTGNSMRVGARSRSGCRRGIT